MTGRYRIITIFAIIFIFFFTTPMTASDPSNIGLDPSKDVVRAYFPNLDIAYKAVRSMDALESKYETGYIILQVSQEDVDLLTQLNFTLEYLSYDEINTIFGKAPQPMMKSFMAAAPMAAQASGISGYSCYRTVEETFDAAQNIVSTYPTLASFNDVGDSWEKSEGLGGYDMKVLKLTNTNITGDKPILFITSAIHAREYATAELATRFAEHLVENYGTDADITWILDYHEVHMMLQANPDGRKKAEQGILWRKNTNQNFCSATSNDRGVDLNRNFPFKWACCGGASNTQCEEDYRGPSAGSEPETQAVVSYLKSIYPDKRGTGDNDAAPDDTSGIYIDIHAHGKLILWPWGETDTPSPNHTQFQTLGRKFAYWNGYKPEKAYGLYATDGTTDGAGYGELGVASFCFELGTAFFEQCDYFNSTILPKNLPVLIYAAKVARTPYLTPAGPDTTDLSLNKGATSPGIPAGTNITLTGTATDTRYSNSNGTEPSQNIAQAEYYIDIPPWENGASPLSLNASDGAFNGKSEGIEGTISTAGLTPGRHTIFVRAKDINGSWGAFSAIFLYISEGSSNIPPQAQFTHTINDMAVTFTDQSSDSDGTITSRSWDFGDGNTSNTEHPSHTYGAAGSYTVKLTVTDSDNASDTYTKEIQVGTIVNYCAANGKDNSYEWIAKVEVGSLSHPSNSETGGYSDNTSITVTMDKGSSYNVTLTPGFKSSSYSETWRIWIDLNKDGNLDDTSEVLFEKSAKTAVSGSFTLPSSAMSGSTRMRVAMRYNNAPTSCGEMDYGEVEDFTVMINSSGPVNQAPQASFTKNATDLTVSFSDQSSDSDGSITSWLWDFGDSNTASQQHPAHTYGSAGTYTVELTVTDNDGGTDSHTASVQVTEPTPTNQAPQASFSKSVSDLTVTFSDLSSDSDGSIASWLWNFGDSNTASQQHPTHTYGSAGTYTVELTVTDNDGATDSHTASVQVTEPAPTNQPPQASFSKTISDLTVAFSDLSSDPDGSIASWLWEFGDSNSSNQQNPSHTYGTAGSYTVKLTVTDNDGATDSNTASVQVTQGPIPITYCASKGTDSSYEWISKVEFGSFSNPSAVEGYGDFTSQTINISKGTSVSVSLTPGFKSSSYSEFFVVWIDLNRDGDFADTGETLFEKSGTSKVSGSFTVPTSALTGETRLRVSMQYNKSAGACETFQYGEVEDYTVNLN